MDESYKSHNIKEEKEDLIESEGSVILSAHGLFPQVS